MDIIKNKINSGSLEPLPCAHRRQRSYSRRQRAQTGLLNQTGRPLCRLPCWWADGEGTTKAPLICPFAICPLPLCRLPTSMAEGKGGTQFDSKGQFGPFVVCCSFFAIGGQTTKGQTAPIYFIFNNIQQFSQK